MRIIELADGSEWACNKYFEGVFSRRKDGTWFQHIGTCDTPRFKSRNHLSRYIRKTLSHSEPLPRMKCDQSW